MRVHLLPAVFQREQDWEHLDIILRTFESGRHRWLIDDEGEIQRSPWFGEWLGKARQRHVRALMGSASAISPIRSTRDRTLHVGAPLQVISNLEWYAPSDIAAARLHRPLSLVVENARCDGDLLWWTLRAVGERRLKPFIGGEEWDTLWKTWEVEVGDGTFFRLEHGAGSTTPQRMSALHPEAPSLPPPVLTVVDGDRDGPGPVKDTSVAHECSDVGASLKGRYHVDFVAALKVWDHRAAENYIPDGALRSFNGAKYHEYRTNIEKISVFADYGNLKQIFGSQLCSAFRDERTKAEIHAQSLRRRAGDELDQLVDQIIELL